MEEKHVKKSGGEKLKEKDDHRLTRRDKHTSNETRRRLVEEEAKRYPVPLKNESSAGIRFNNCEPDVKVLSNGNVGEARENPQVVESCEQNEIVREENSVDKK